MCNFDIRQSNHQEWRLRQTDKTICRRQQQNIRPERHTIKTQIPEWNINLHLPVTLSSAPSTSVYRIRNLLRKFFEFFVQSSPSSPFLGLLFMLIIIPISIFPFPIPRLIDLSICPLSEEL